MAKAGTSATEDRWEAKPVLAAIVRGVAFVVPIAMSTTFAIVVSGLLPPSKTRAGQIVVWLLVAAASTGVLMVVDLVARRLLPLAALFNLAKGRSLPTVGRALPHGRG